MRNWQILVLQHSSFRGIHAQPEKELGFCKKRMETNLIRQNKNIRTWRCRTLICRTLLCFSARSRTSVSSIGRCRISAIACSRLATNTTCYCTRCPGTPRSPVPVDWTELFLAGFSLPDIHTGIEIPVFTVTISKPQSSTTWFCTFTPRSPLLVNVDIVRRFFCKI